MGAGGVEDSGFMPVPTEPVATAVQPAPKANSQPALWSLVISDMAARDAFGAKKYGVRLQAHNGRDFLVDAYQEMLDHVVYLRGLIFERDGR